MQKALVFLGLLLLCTTLSFGQVQSAGQGYAFGGIGATAPDAYGPLYHIGAGGEGLIKKFGIGAELGYLSTDFRDGVGVLSVNGSYHFQPQRKWDPFVTAGYSLFFPDATAKVFNFGGGTNYWVGERLGLRVEFRDHIDWEYKTEHFLQLRLGLSFR